jgi:hypothetical protein
MALEEVPFKFLKDNWKTLKNAPLVFLGTLALGSIIGWFAVMYFYEERINTLKIRIDDLKERLHDVPLQHTVYSRLNNRELKQRAVNLVGKMRGLLADLRKEHDQLSESEWEARQEVTSDEERKELMRKYGSRLVNYRQDTCLNIQANLRLKLVFYIMK